MDGSIRLLQDDTLGGTIIRDGQVINNDAMVVLKAKEDDRKLAAQAQQISHDATEEAREDRVVAPSKIQELEKKVADQDVKLDAILALLQKK